MMGNHSGWGTGLWVGVIHKEDVEKAYPVIDEHWGKEVRDRIAFGHAEKGEFWIYHFHNENGYDPVDNALMRAGVRFAARYAVPLGWDHRSMTTTPELPVRPYVWCHAYEGGAQMLACARNEEAHRDWSEHRKAMEQSWDADPITEDIEEDRVMDVRSTPHSDTSTGSYSRLRDRLRNVSSERLAQMCFELSDRCSAILTETGKQDGVRADLARRLEVVRDTIEDRLYDRTLFHPCLIQHHGRFLVVTREKVEEAVLASFPDEWIMGGL